MVQLMQSRRLPFLVLVTVLLIVVKLVAYPTPTLLAQGDDGQIYIVQLDDTLWKVAEKYLGDGNRFDEIVVATQTKHAEDSSFAQIIDPGLIFAGSKLWISGIPASSSSSESSDVTAPLVPSDQIESSSGKQISPVVSSVSGPAGQIAFSFWNNAPNRCTYEINVIDVSACLANAEVCQANRRIFALNNASEPALSPDGERLAFRGWGGIPEKHLNSRLDHPYFSCASPQAERHLGHTSLDGTDYRGTGIFYEDSHPDWSPDGRRILFDTGRNGDGILRIMTVTFDGTFEEDLRIAGQQPSWATDNDRFVYRGCDPTGNRCGLWLARAIPVQAWDVGVNIIGPLLEESEAAHPDWSPVGDQIVYQSPAAGSWDLYVINADGSNRQQLTSDVAVEGLPSWSPDGEWIAYLSNVDGNWGIWIIRIGGSERHLLFPFDGGNFTPKVVTPYFSRDWIDEQISWSR